MVQYVTYTSVWNLKPPVHTENKLSAEISYVQYLNFWDEKSLDFLNKEKGM